jgi:hypothetical protein
MSLNNKYKIASSRLNRVIAEKKYMNDDQCSICLSSMLNKTVLHIPCGHIFHNNCINGVFKSNCLTKYKCPLCRCDIYSALQKLGFQPLQNNNHVEMFDPADMFGPAQMLAPDQMFEEDENFSEEEIYTISDILELISNSFSPVCFYNTIINIENPICQICKDAFIHLTETSQNIDIGIKNIVHMYNEEQNGIITLFDDVKYLFNSNDDDNEYMLQIFPDYDISRPVSIPH